MKSHLPSFSGKVLSVLCADEDSSQLIENPIFEVQGDRLFLIGTVPKGCSPDWLNGLSCAIAWDLVQSYVIFDSLEGYNMRREPTSPKRKKKKTKKNK